MILQVVNDRIGEICRQLQQEIDQRWDIKSRNLQNQINQLQQNQPLKTPDNVAGGDRESQRKTNDLPMRRELSERRFVGNVNRCSNCGTQIREQDTYCRICGYDVVSPRS